MLAAAAAAAVQSVHLVRLLTSQVNTASSNRDLWVTAYRRCVCVYSRALRYSQQFDAVCSHNGSHAAYLSRRCNSLGHYCDPEVVTVWDK